MYINDKIINTLQELLNFSQECFEIGYETSTDIRLDEQEEYKNAVDLLRELQILQQKQELDIPKNN